MDSQAYLDQISASNSTASTGNKLFSSKIFKIGLIAIGALVLILIVGMLLGGSGDNLKNKIISLKLHTANLSTEISKYQSQLKSSNLRSSTASLRGILDSTTSTLSGHIKNVYGIKDNKEIDAKLTKKETDLSDKLEEDLFSAKINGLLDRTFASKMAYEITYVTSKEKDIIKQSKNAEFKSSLESSLNSLNNLYNMFNNYSETR